MSGGEAGARTLRGRRGALPRRSAVTRGHVHATLSGYKKMSYPIRLRKDELPRARKYMAALVAACRQYATRFGYRGRGIACAPPLCPAAAHGRAYGGILRQMLGHTARGEGVSAIALEPVALGATYAAHLDARSSDGVGVSEHTQLTVVVCASKQLLRWPRHSKARVASSVRELRHQ